MRKIKNKNFKFCNILIAKVRFINFGLAFCVLIFAFQIYCFAQEKIIAIVNNDVITQKDLADFENFMRVQLDSKYTGAQLEEKIHSLKADLLNRLIEDRLILFEANKNDIKVDENKIAARLNEIRKHYASNLEFQETLKSQGMVEADLEARIREQMLMYNIIENKVKGKIVISPFEAADFYQKNSKEFMAAKTWELVALAIDELDLASKIYAKLKNGQKFGEAASENSLSINTLAVTQGQLKEDIENIIAGLKPGELSEPVKIENKYYIFTLIKYAPERLRSLSESLADIYDFLYSVKLKENMVNWLNELKKQAYIKIMAD